MLKKGLAALIFGVVFCAGSLAAAGWQGTYSGSDAGTIEGKITEDVDPPVYKGTWASYADYAHNYGTWYGVAWDVVNNCYYVEQGDIYDDTDALVGHWTGYFPISDDALAYGKWWKFNGWYGTWTMERNP